MIDLIDRKAAIDKLDCAFEEGNIESFNDVVGIIEELPIAYNIDKVVDEVGEMKIFSLRLREKLISIIKSGGIPKKIAARARRDNENIHLEPCPLCGKEVSIALMGSEDWHYWWGITRGINENGSKNCRCRLFMESEKFYDKDGGEQEKADLIEKWNKRA